MVHVKVLRYTIAKTQVGWVKADTKAIQAIGNTIITHNARLTIFLCKQKCSCPEIELSEDLDK